MLRDRRMIRASIDKGVELLVRPLRLSKFLRLPLKVSDAIGCPTRATGRGRCSR